MYAHRKTCRDMLDEVLKNARILGLDKFAGSVQHLLISANQSSLRICDKLTSPPASLRTGEDSPQV